MAKLKFYKRFKEPDAQWVEITKEKCIDLLEGHGHWKKNTTIQMLKAGNILWTPTAEFKACFGLPTNEFSKFS